MSAWQRFLSIAVVVGLTATAAAAPLGERERASAFARLPDWSGRWEVVGVTPNAAGGIIESFEEIERRFGAHPPYNAEGEARVNALLKQFPDGPPGGDRAICAWGVPMLMLESPLMFEALITPEETALIFSGREIRHVYTDGRKHLPADQLFPTHWGDSIGRWEGRTLVIDTVAVDSPVIFIWGGGGGGALRALLSEQAHFIERLHLIGKDLLEDVMTIDDPASLASPWTLTHQYRRVASPDRMIHEDCEGNERNPVVNGHFTLKLE